MKKFYKLIEKKYAIFLKRIKEEIFVGNVI